MYTIDSSVHAKRNSLLFEHINIGYMLTIKLDLQINGNNCHNSGICTTVHGLKVFVGISGVGMLRSGIFSLATAS